MILALTLLLSCQLFGEVVARGLGVPVPGPVIGLALLVGLLALFARLRPEAPELSRTSLGRTVAVLLANLSLLFVPAGVGILRNAPAITSHGVGLIMALVGSTVLTLVVTALVFRGIAARTGGQEAPTSNDGASL